MLEPRARTPGWVLALASARAAPLQSILELTSGGVERFANQRLQRLVQVDAVGRAGDDHFAEGCRDVEAHAELPALVLMAVRLVEDHVAALDQLTGVCQALGALLDQRFYCGGGGQAAEGDL